MAGNDIPYERLIALLTGELHAQDAREVQAAIDASPRLSATVERLRTIIATMRTDDSVAPPPAVADAARALFAHRTPAARSDLAAGLVELVARLVYDSRPQPALAGVRGAGAAYQLSFESPIADVDLDVEPQAESDAAERRFRVSGQATPARTEDRVAGVRLTPRDASRPAAVAEADEHGVFGLTVAAGTYSMRIEIDGRTVLLDNLEIG